MHALPKDGRAEPGSEAGLGSGRAPAILHTESLGKVALGEP